MVFAFWQTLRETFTKENFLELVQTLQSDPGTPTRVSVALLTGLVTVLVLFFCETSSNETQSIDSIVIVSL